MGVGVGMRMVRGTNGQWHDRVVDGGGDAVDGDEYGKEESVMRMGGMMVMRVVTRL